MSSEDFEMVTRTTYLAGCSHTPVYQGLIDSMEQYKQDLIEFGNPWDSWVQKVSEVKELFARLINADPEEVAPHFSVSSAFGALLSAFEYSRKNELVISDMEYPTSNHVLLGQEKFGAKVITLKNRNYRIEPEDYKKVINPKTRLVSAVHVSSLNGFLQNVKQIGEYAHSGNSEIYVDAYQSIGNVPIDVKKMDMDYLTAGTLKYLLGLPGLAFLYVRKELIKNLEPAYIGWFSQKDPFQFGAEKLEYADSADRFQSGTWAIPALYASITGLKVILKKGVPSIREKITSLTRKAMDLGSELGLKTISPENDEERGAMVSFVVNEPHQMENRLRSEGIITSSRGIGLRIAPHFYNTGEDIEKAVRRIAEMNSGK
ncbi:hypothetical protein IX51_05335 [uncultured archaeon]|nr:hypothetical protein IX51_05335 [uncultured archaeon]HKJ96658.1 aminotransferase class V-fold PLP-dependent enzyme [Thermoplasmataceae archaeon]